MTTRTIAAGEFKAKCLALLDEVAAEGTTLIVTKRGKPVAKVTAAPPVDPRAELKGSVRILGDVLSPIDDWQYWSEEEKFK